MEFRKLGHSGLKVPLLSFGTGTFGGKGDFFGAWGSSDVKEASRLVDICLEAGLNLFDSADVYSGGAAEEVLGAALKGRRDRVLISTKGTFRRGDGPNEVGSSRLALTRAIEGSLRRLGTDYIDLYQLHGFDAQTPVEEVLQTLDGFVRAGKIRYLGVSNFSGWHLMKSLAVSEKYGLARYVAHQAYYSLLGRDYEWELMPLALDQGVGTVVWSPLGWGRLTGKIRRGQPLPKDSRLNAQIVIDKGPPHRGRAPVPRHRCARVRRRGDRQDRAAGRAQLADPAPDRLDHHHRRAQRGAAPAESRRRRLEPDPGPDRAARRRQRGEACLPVLAPARLRRTQSAAGLRSFSLSRPPG